LKNQWRTPKEKSLVKKSSNKGEVFNLIQTLELRLYYIDNLLMPYNQLQVRSELLVHKILLMHCVREHS